MGFPQRSSGRRSFGRSKRISMARSLDDLEVRFLDAPHLFSSLSDLSKVSPHPTLASPPHTPLSDIKLPRIPILSLRGLGMITLRMSDLRNTSENRNSQACWHERINTNTHKHNQASGECALQGPYFWNDRYEEPSWHHSEDIPVY